ncbi:hypothetical protein CLU79DRAFT_587841 [Phycomyces nitens]|nr:hypothetical protein CLU79DRAFT_587841 [Phycomyces nitens]
MAIGCQVTRRRRLATLTMNGRLDVWDFDVSRQIVLKDQSAVYQSLLGKDSNDMFDVAFDLVNNEQMPSLCMALTSRNVIIFALSGVDFIPHVTLVSKPETSWTGGAFCGPDRCVLWTQNGEFYDYHLKAPEGVRPGVMVDESQLYYSAHLMKAYCFDNEGLSLSLGSLNVTLCKGLEEPTAILFCNRPTASAFCLVPLGNFSEVKQASSNNDTITVRAESTFADIWPLKTHKDPVFGHITATTTVSSHHLALAYENGTICIVPIALALLHLHEISQYLDQGVRAFERAHDGEVTCMIVPESHQVAGHHYLLSGGRDGAVKIWNLM